MDFYVNVPAKFTFIKVVRNVPPWNLQALLQAILIVWQEMVTAYLKKKL